MITPDELTHALLELGVEVEFDENFGGYFKLMCPNLDTFSKARTIMHPLAFASSQFKNLLYVAEMQAPPDIRERLKMLGELSPRTLDLVPYIT